VAVDVVHALIAERERIVEVVRPIETRVGAPVAVTCYIEDAPEPEVRAGDLLVPVAATGITPTELTGDETYQHADGIVVIEVGAGR
jgi:ribosome-associated heat shock protein Hsp15